MQILVQLFKIQSTCTHVSQESSRLLWEEEAWPTMMLGVWVKGDLCESIRRPPSCPPLEEKRLCQPPPRWLDWNSSTL